MTNIKNAPNQSYESDSKNTIKWFSVWNLLAVIAIIVFFCLAIKGFLWPPLDPREISLQAICSGYIFSVNYVRTWLKNGGNR